MNLFLHAVSGSSIIKQSGGYASGLDHFPYPYRHKEVIKNYGNGSKLNPNISLTLMLWLLKIRLL